LAKGNEGYANFNLEYAPFSLNDAVWNGFDNLTALNLKIGKPVWIIRNGANDVAQDPDTTTFGSIGADGKVAEKPDWNGTTKNGNGAVTFKVLDPAGDEDNDKYPNGGEVENGYDPVDENSWPEGGIGIKGAGDNATISEENLLDVLGVSTVAKAIEELHKRLNNEGTTGPYLDGLRLGMYLDLPSLTPTGEDTIIMPDSYYPNLRIVIASFDQYKGMMGNNDTRHIKFVFKNSPVEKKMRSIESNYGGYPYATNDKTHGTPELKEYLEGPFFDGLKKALGCNYFYRVTRNITGGNKTDGWKTVSFSAEIFIDTEMEVLGNNEYSKLTTEGDLPQTALYRTNAAPGKIWKIKLYGTNPKSWWFATPKSNMNYVFCAGMMNGSAGGAASNYYDLLGVVPAFCIQ
jgi:hypothetical protein